MVKYLKQNALFASDSGFNSDDSSEDSDVKIGRPKLAFSDADKP